jgi:hypothetical protein
VVGFCLPPPGAKHARSHISRRTKGAKQLGVISRRAIVAGSFPGEAIKHEFDIVAYCGRLPVKMIGTTYPFSFNFLTENQFCSMWPFV